MAAASLLGFGLFRFASNKASTDTTRGPPHPRRLLALPQVSEQIRDADSAPSASWMQRKRAEAKKANPVAL